MLYFVQFCLNIGVIIDILSRMDRNSKYLLSFQFNRKFVKGQNLTTQFLLISEISNDNSISSLAVVTCAVVLYNNNNHGVFSFFIKYQITWPAEGRK